MSRKVLLLTIAAIINSPIAHACTCFPTTVEDEWNEAKHVFTARIDHVEVRPGEYSAEDHVRFTVLERLKGQPEELPNLVAPRTSCGVFMEPGEEWVITTNESGTVSMCGASARLGLSDHPGDPVLFGEIVLEQFRARKMDEQNACAYSQVELVKELQRLIAAEHLSGTGWTLEEASLENRHALFASDTGLLLELKLDGCDRLARSLEVRKKDGESMVLADFDKVAISVARSFWPDKHAKEFVTLLETQQYDLSRQNGVLRYELFHPTLNMEMVYDVEKDVLQIAYRQ